MAEAYLAEPSALVAAQEGSPWLLPPPPEGGASRLVDLNLHADRSTPEPEVAMYPAVAALG